VAFSLGIISTWAPTIMGEAGAGSLLEASLYASLVGLGMVPGHLVNGALVDALTKRGIREKYVVVANMVGFAMVLALFGWAVSGGWPRPWIAVILFLAGYFGEGYFSPQLALYVRLVPKPILGTVMGTSTTLAYSAIVVSAVFSGWLRDLAGSYAPSLAIAFILVVVTAWFVPRIRVLPISFSADG
jgi:MFS family permease